MLFRFTLILMSAWCWPATATADPPPGLFRFDAQGQVKTQTGQAERTFAFPDLKVGFIVDIANPDIVPHTTLELVDGALVGQRISLDAGVALHRLVIGLSWKFLQPIELGPFLWLGYHVPDQRFAWGVGFSLVHF